MKRRITDRHTRINRLQREADHVEAMRQIGHAVECLVGNRMSMQHRLRDAAYPLSMVPESGLPPDLQHEYRSIWQQLVGPEQGTSNLLVRIDRTLAGMGSTTMAALSARIVALQARLLELDRGFRSIEGL
ncbi:MAG: hypothetical protein AB1806_11125 [Acidobacteriota bacterium]